MNETLLQFDKWISFLSVFCMLRTYKYLELMDADDVIRTEFSHINKFSVKFLKVDFASHKSGTNLDLKSNYDFIFGSFNENTLIHFVSWVDNSLPKIGGKKELINEDWSYVMGKIYEALKDDKSNLPQYVVDNKNLLQSLVSSAEQESELQIDLYQLQKGMILLDDHDIGMINIRNEISYMGLGRAPRVSPLDSYCNLIGLISSYNHTEKLKSVFLNPLSLSEKHQFLEWVINEDVLIYINENYSREEFISQES